MIAEPAHAIVEQFFRHAPRCGKAIHGLEKDEDEKKSASFDQLRRSNY